MGGGGGGGFLSPRRQEPPSPGAGGQLSRQTEGQGQTLPGPTEDSLLREGFLGRGTPHKIQSPLLTPPPSPRIQRACCSTGSSSIAHRYTPQKPRTPGSHKARGAAKTLAPHPPPPPPVPEGPPAAPRRKHRGGQARPVPKTLAGPHPARSPTAGRGKAGTSAPLPADPHTTPRNAAATD